MRAICIPAVLAVLALAGSLRAAEPDLARIGRLDSEVAAFAKAARIRRSFRWTEADKRAWLARFGPAARERALEACELAAALGEPAGHRTAARACRSYLDAFEGAERDRELRLAMAESLYRGHDYLEAARIFEAEASGPEAADNMLSALRSFFHAFSEPEISRSELAEIRAGYRRVANRFLDAFPDAPEAPMVLFNRARLAYDEADYVQAAMELEIFVERHPAHRMAPMAGYLILDSHHQREDYDALLLAAKRLHADPRIRDERFKRELRTIIDAIERRGLLYYDLGNLCIETY
ncbi:MAG: hypothetical protein JXR96_15580 [Deltaproteobacteria bacterium]|nr:hypothetical protein [Deltaproteobacteria bacterium]